MTTRDRLTLGTAQLGMRYGATARGPAPDRRRALEILAAAADLGIARLDTAPGYGAAEERVGAFMKSSSVRFTITTKLPALPAAVDAATLPALVERSVTGSLHRLGVECIDCCLVHRAADLAVHGRALADAMQMQVDQGRIARAGVSAYKPNEARLVLRWPGLDVVQHPLNLLDRRLGECGTLAELAAHGIEIEARSVLLQGLLCVAPDDPAAVRVGAGPILARLDALLAEAGSSAVEVALPFAFAAGAHRAVIGVETRAQLEAAVASLERGVPERIAAVLATLPDVDPVVIDPRRWPA